MTTRAKGTRIGDSAHAAVRGLLRTLSGQQITPEAQIAALAALQRGLQQSLSLEELLQRVASCAAELLGTPRVTIRLLDPSRTRLIAACRFGEPLHWNAEASFSLGEGLLGWIAEQHEALRLASADDDPRFLPRPDQKAPVGAYLGVPLMAGQICVGVISATRVAPFVAHDEDILALLAGLCAPHVEVARLMRLAETDPLTGTLNRRGLAEELGELPADDGRELSVVMVDVDHFKRINDQHGHVTGDQVLVSLASRLSTLVRPSDSVVRYGGEEFLLLLPGVTSAAALRIAERARAGIAVSQINDHEAGLRITVSMGVAERKSGESRDVLIRRADAALYAAKQAGRNRVVIAVE
jgi:diguanylate cyclase (GGDEF)-like protein